MKNPPQILGCAYTYPGSLGIRRRLTSPLLERGIHHSSQVRDFSYFYKGNADTVAYNNEPLNLRDETVTHWPEAELAIILGKRHTIVGYTLANDFTAIEIEAKGRTADFDGTYIGKVWRGSCSLGPRTVSPHEIDVDHLDIGLRIVRDGSVCYDHMYNTQSRTRKFDELANKIVELHNEKFKHHTPLSKKIEIEDGFLLEGTVILTGTGVIVPKRCYSRRGDLISVYSAPIGELLNEIV